MYKQLNVENVKKRERRKEGKKQVGGVIREMNMKEEKRRKKKNIDKVKNESKR